VLLPTAFEKKQEEECINQQGVVVKNLKITLRVAQ
jgi:hypothetical protein